MRATSFLKTVFDLFVIEVSRTIGNISSNVEQLTGDVFLIKSNKHEWFAAAETTLSNGSGSMYIMQLPPPVTFSAYCAIKRQLFVSLDTPVKIPFQPPMEGPF